MKVNLFQNPKNPNGLAASFGYSKQWVDEIKACLGFHWDKKNKLWEADGPEVLLDMDRFQIGVEYMSPEARVIADSFREELWESLNVRSEPIGEELYAYQKQGTKFLASQKRAILADFPRLGKTRQSLDALAQIGASRVLVLSPKTPSYNWLAEIEKWHPEYEAEVVPDGTTQRSEFWEEPLPNIIIANYEKTRLSDWPFYIDWDVVILDEVSNIKNLQTAAAKAVKRILKFTNRVWALTGSPLEIRLEELYSIFVLLRPAVLGSYYRFRDQHIELNWKGEVTGTKNIELLRDRIGYWMLRRTREQVLKYLPPKPKPENYWVKLSVPEQKEYQKLITEFSAFLEEHEIGGSKDPMIKTVRMRQFCCSPALLGIEQRGSKYEALLDLINGWEGQILIFCYFEQMISLLSTWLQQDIGYNPEALISGKITAASERYRRQKAFNEGKLGKVFLTTDASNRGMDLSGASMVIHYDQIFNTQHMRQREDRAFHPKKTDPVSIVNLLCMDTIDIGMYLLGLERQELFDNVVEGTEEAMLKKFSPARWRQLIRGRLS